MRAYGSITLKDGVWRVDAEPHVMLRMRRVFGKIAKRQSGTLRFPDTPENCRELHWFAQRYPMDVDPEAALEAGATQHRESIQRLEDLIGGAYEPTEFNLAVPARQYQMQAAAAYLEQGHLLLADDVGLGKTAAAICSFLDPRTLPAAVVCLAHLPGQWFREIKKFAPDLLVHLVKKTEPYPLPTLLGRGPDVLVLSYHKLHGWAEVLAKHCRSVVFDECQELRRDESAKYDAAQHIAQHVPFKLGLSATPVYNYGSEIYNVLNILKPDALGTREEFSHEWNVDVEGRIKEPKALGTYLRESFHMLRRTRQDVKRELPGVIRIPQVIESDAKALDSVKPAARELAKVLLARTQEFRGQKMQAAEQLSNLLRQSTGISKAPYVADFVRLLVESGEKVVLAGWHRAVYAIWESKLADLRPAFYTGTETAAHKASSVARFTDPKHNDPTSVFIISLRSGAGLDGLQNACRTVVVGELDWSPGVIDQLIGRVARDGQPDPVTAYFLLSEDGSDPVMSETLGLKREQAEGIRNPTQDISDQLDTSGDNARRLAEDYLRRIGAHTEDVDWSTEEPVEKGA